MNLCKILDTSYFQKISKLEFVVESLEGGAQHEYRVDQYEGQVEEYARVADVLAHLDIWKPVGKAYHMVDYE